LGEVALAVVGVSGLLVGVGDLYRQAEAGMPGGGDSASCRGGRSGRGQAFGAAGFQIAG